MLKFILRSLSIGKGTVTMSVRTTFSVVSTQQLLGRPLNDVEEKYNPNPLYLASCRSIPVPGPRTAIVGSRKASSQGIEAATEIASFLVKKDVVIVSGLAEGIDTSAHKTAIEKGGSTIAVLGTPLNKAYPAKNKELQDTIMQKHWAVSQFSIGQPIQPKNFVLRNRTMALICDASIIVEAGETSGSLHQGWEALRLGRPLFIWKTIVRNHSLKWPDDMMKYGAMELNEPEEIMENLPSPKRTLEIAI